MEAIITYRPDAQKTPGLYDRILTHEILKDICVRVTGQDRFSVIRDTSTYNRGRLVIIEYGGIKNFVSLSEVLVEGRNQSVQSIPTAINLYYADSNSNKKLYYYFMPHRGNYFTDYHLFYFRLLKTAGVVFLNILRYYPADINAFESIDELIDERMIIEKLIDLIILLLFQRHPIKFKFTQRHMEQVNTNLLFWL